MIKQDITLTIICHHSVCAIYDLLNPIAYGILRLSQLWGGIFIPHPRKQC